MKLVCNLLSYVLVVIYAFLNTVCCPLPRCSKTILQNNIATASLKESFNIHDVSIDILQSSSGVCKTILDLKFNLKVSFVFLIENLDCLEKNCICFYSYLMLQHYFENTSKIQFGE